MNSKIPGTIVAGVLATLAMTLVGLYVAPLMGIPAMNPANMLAAQMGGSLLLGWAAHLMIGVVLAIIYAFVAAPRLSGPAPVRGAVFSLAPWLLAQVAVMPMMGMGLFSSSASMATGSLIGHLVYGVVLGAIVEVTVRAGESELNRSSLTAATR